MFLLLLQQHAYCIIIVVRVAPGARKSRSTATRDPSRGCPPLTRITRHPREISSAVYRVTRAFVRVQLPYSRASWVVTVTPPRRVVGRPRARALKAQVWRVPRRLSGIDRPPTPTISNAAVAVSNSRRRSDFRGRRRRCYNYMYNVYAWSASCAP